MPDNINTYSGLTRQLAIKLRDDESRYTVEDVRKDWRAYCAWAVLQGDTAPTWAAWLQASGWLDA